MTSSLGCASPASVNSNNITMSVGATAQPTISITTSANSICQGTSVTFNSTAVNGGSTPTYQWEKNGTNVGTNSSTYTSTSINNNDIISCSMTSSLGCASPASVNSNII